MAKENDNLEEEQLNAGMGEVLLKDIGIEVQRAIVRHEVTDVIELAKLIKARMKARNLDVESDVWIVVNKVIEDPDKYLYPFFMAFSWYDNEILKKMNHD